MVHPDDPRSARLDPRMRRTRQALDAVVYGVVVVAAVVVVSAVISVPIGWGLVGVKYALFFLGFFLFGFSAFRLRPTPPWKDSEDPERREESRFGAFVQRIPPLDRYGLVPDDRLSTAARLFVASLLMLALSFLLETVFGVAA